MQLFFGKKLQSFAAKILNVEAPPIFAESKEVSKQWNRTYCSRKNVNTNAVIKNDKNLHAGSDIRVKVNIVGSQDTTGLMTCQELESMAATTISPIIDGAYQSGCHTASVWDLKAQKKHT